MKIRKAIKKDLSIIMEIEKVFKEDAFELESFVPLLKDKQVLFNVVEYNKNVIGYYILDIRRISKIAHIESIAVLPEYHGKGVASFMLNDIEEKAKELKIEQIDLEVSAINESARYLYEKKFNYEIVGFNTDYYMDNSDAFLMKKCLT